jgi:hypothetical protein
MVRRCFPVAKTAGSSPVWIASRLFFFFSLFFGGFKQSSLSSFFIPFCFLSLSSFEVSTELREEVNKDFATVVPSLFCTDHPVNLSPESCQDTNTTGFLLEWNEL